MLALPQRLPLMLQLWYVQGDMLHAGLSDEFAAEVLKAAPDARKLATEAARILVTQRLDAAQSEAVLLHEVQHLQLQAMELELKRNALKHQLERVTAAYLFSQGMLTPCGMLGT